MTARAFAGRALVAVSLVAGVVASLALGDALSSESTKTGCLPEETLWQAISEPDRTFQSAIDAAKVTVADTAAPVSGEELDEALAGAELRDADEGPITLQIGSTIVTITKLGPETFAPDQVTWCQASK